MAFLYIPIAEIWKVVLYAIEMAFVCLLDFVTFLFVPKSFQYKKNLTGQTVLITGAGSGLGRLLAIAFSKHSTRLVLLDINKSSLLDTEKLLQPNTSSFVYECDVSDRRKVYEVADIIKRDVGKVDILINNAGIVSGKRFLDISDEEIEKTMQVNTLAHFWTCKAFLPAMMETNQGHIVSIASAAGKGALGNLTDYCASKFAVIGFMESLHIELHSQNLTGIKLTTMSPTIMTTGLFDGAKSPLNVTLTPEYVAEETMQAIIAEKYDVTLPGYFAIICALKGILPTRLRISFARRFELLHIMDEFKGRGRPVVNGNHRE